MPAGFQYGAVASSQTAVNAPPMPTARAPTAIFMNSPAYLVAAAGDASNNNGIAAAARERKRFMNGSWGRFGAMVMPGGSRGERAIVKRRRLLLQMSTGSDSGFHSCML